MGHAVAYLQYAVAAAPWRAKGDYNLAIAQEGAARYDLLQCQQMSSLCLMMLTGAADLYGKAAENLQLYLIGSPNAPDSQEVEKKIFALKLKKAQAERGGK